MSDRRYSESEEEKVETNALLDALGYVYEEGSRKRYRLKDLVLAIARSKIAVDTDGEHINFRIKPPRIDLGKLSK